MLTPLMLLVGAGSSLAAPYVAGAHPLRLMLTPVIKLLTLEDAVANVIEIVEGDTAGPILVTLSNADGPQVLTGATLTVQAREQTTRALLTIENVTIVDEDLGTAEIPGSARAAIPAGRYDLRVIAEGEERDIFPSTRDPLIADPPVLVVSPAWT